MVCSDPQSKVCLLVTVKVTTSCYRKKKLCRNSMSCILMHIFRMHKSLQGLVSPAKSLALSLSVCISLRLTFPSVTKVTGSTVNGWGSGGIKILSKDSVNHTFTVHLLNCTDGFLHSNVLIMLVTKRCTHALGFVNEGRHFHVQAELFCCRKSMIIMFGKPIQPLLWDLHCILNIVKAFTVCADDIKLNRDGH